MRDLQLTATDMVVGLAASGRTPYVIGALRFARQLGCPTAAISCNPDSPIAREALVAISPVVGPEALTGSTRMKSGTAQKLVLKSHKFNQLKSATTFQYNIIVLASEGQ